MVWMMFRCRGVCSDTARPVACVATKTSQKTVKMAFRWYCDLVMQHSLSWYRDIVTSDCCHQNLKMAFRSDFWEAWSKEALLLAEIRFCRPTSYQQQRNIVKTMYSFSGPTWRKRTQRSWSWGRRGWRSWCWRRTRSAAASAPAYLPGIALAILMRFGLVFSMGSLSNNLTTFQFVDVAWISEKYFVVGLVFADTGSDAIMLSCWCTVHFITSSWYNHHRKS